MLTPSEIVGEMLKRDEFSKWAEMSVLLISPGLCELELQVNKNMLNGFDILHGGMAFSLADSAVAFAANAKGRFAKTLDAHFSFLAPSETNSRLVAKAKELRSGHKVGFFRVEVFNHEKMVASGSFTVSFSAEIWKK